MRRLIIAVVVAAALLGGCSSTPPEITITHEHRTCTTNYRGASNC